MCTYLSNCISIFNSRIDNKGFCYRSIDIALDKFEIAVESHVPIRGSLTQPLAICGWKSTQRYPQNQSYK